MNHSNADKRPDETVQIEPLFNTAFARIFGREESKPVTLALTNAIIDHIGVDPITEIDRIDAEHTATEGRIKCKAPRMDVRIIAAGRAIDLEAQGYPEDLNERSLFYGSQLICENTPRGIMYKDIPQAIVITLLDAPAAFPTARLFHRMRDVLRVIFPQGQLARFTRGVHIDDTLVR